jgi:hypothetical protein
VFRGHDGRSFREIGRDKRREKETERERERERDEEEERACSV